MQQQYLQNPEILACFINSLSRERFHRYLRAAEQGAIEAISLYLWNIRVSQSLYVYLQSWEICLRNRIDTFLRWKHGEDWPYASRFLRNLKGDDRRRLTEAIERQKQNRG